LTRSVDGVNLVTGQKIKKRQQPACKKKGLLNGESVLKVDKVTRLSFNELSLKTISDKLS
jgi:hypothetical protein